MTEDGAPGRAGGPGDAPGREGETGDASAPDRERAVRPDVSNEDAREKAAQEDGDQPKSYGTILEEEIFQGLHELERPALGLSLSGLSAGLDIGFSLLLMGVLYTLLEGVVADSLLKLIVSNAYAVGFIFVIVGRSELFTEHTTLAAFPVLGRRAGVGRLARLWGIVYASNVVGAIAFAVLVTWIAPPLGAVERSAFGHIASELVEHESDVIFASAVLAGWMMGLLSWLLAASQETISRIVMVWLVTASIGLAGLHHCIVGTVEVMAGVIAAGIPLSEFLRFLLWASVGNAVGGVFFVGLIKYSHAIKGPQIPPRYGGR